MIPLRSADSDNAPRRHHPKIPLIVFQMKSLRRLFAFIFLMATSVANGSSLRVTAPPDLEGVEFGLKNLQTALEQRGHQLSETGGEYLDISLNTALPAQGFRLEKSADGGGIRLEAGDAAGAMYGLLELAEHIRLYDFAGAVETTQAPFQLKRGIKYNIPLDVRSPSYSDASDSAQHALEET